MAKCGLLTQKNTIFLVNISSTVWNKLRVLLEYVVVMPVQKMSTSLQCSVCLGAMQLMPFKRTKALSMEDPAVKSTN